MTYAIFEITHEGTVVLANTEDLFGQKQLTFLHQREAISLLESEICKSNPKVKGKRFTILTYFDDGFYQPILSRI